MAQWIGQFTSNTHKTKVQDCEESLRHAVEALTRCTDSEKVSEKQRSVRKLAQKLLIARTKLLRAQIYEAEPVLDEQASKTNKSIVRWREKLDTVERAGVDGILVEFGVDSSTFGS